MGFEALLASLPEVFSAGAADAGAFAAGDAGLAAAADAGLATIPADIAGTGAALAGGEVGLAGTLAAGGSGLGIADLAAGTAGLGALGTAADFVGGGAGTAGAGFGATADAAATQAANTGLASGIQPGIGAPGGGAGVLGALSPPPQPLSAGGVSSLSPNVANANAGASVFDTGTAGVTPSPGVTPGGASASALSAPSGVSSPFGADPTAVTGGAGASPAGATGASSAPTSIDSLVKGATDSLTKNPLGVALGAAGLGYNILTGQKQTANQNALAADAATATANSGALLNQGEALTQYLTNGTLPPAYQTQVDQAINDAKTQAIANAAAQGQPTDPTKNTALAQSLAAIDNQRGAMQTQVASQLFNSGAGLINSAQGAAGLSGQLYQTLVNNDTTQAANTGKAIATLAAALNGKSSNSAGGVTVSTG
jgi:hypothetical protein